MGPFRNARILGVHYRCLGSQFTFPRWRGRPSLNFASSKTAIFLEGHWHWRSLLSPLWNETGIRALLELSVTILIWQSSTEQIVYQVYSPYTWVAITTFQKTFSSPHDGNVPIIRRSDSPKPIKDRVLPSTRPWFYSPNTVSDYRFVYMPQNSPIRSKVMIRTWKRSWLHAIDHRTGTSVFFGFSKYLKWL